MSVSRVDTRTYISLNDGAYPYENGEGHGGG